jgi:hypothetical protein
MAYMKLHRCRMWSARRSIIVIDMPLLFMSLLGLPTRRVVGNVVSNRCGCVPTPIRHAHRCTKCLVNRRVPLVPSDSPRPRQSLFRRRAPITVRVCHGVSGLDYSFQKTLAYYIMNHAIGLVHFANGGSYSKNTRLATAWFARSSMLRDVTSTNQTVAVSRLGYDFRTPIVTMTNEHTQVLSRATLQKDSDELCSLH